MAGRPPPSFVDDDDEYDNDHGDDADARSAAADAAQRNALASRALGFAFKSLEYSVDLFKWGWLPFTFLIGVTGVYCTSDRPAFANLRGAAQPPQ
jgi:hypothetical protein